MRIAFAENLRANGKEIFFLLEAFDDDRRTVRDLIAKRIEELFTNDLRSDGALGLVCDDIVGEEPRSFHCKFFNLVQNNGNVFTVFRGDRNDRVKGMIFGKARDGITDLTRIGNIGLIDDENGGNLCAIKTAKKLLFHSAYAVACFHEQKHDIHVCRRTVCDLHHIRAELILRLMDTRGIEENELCFVLGEDTRDTGSGGLRLGRYDGDMLAEKCIEKRGFTDVRSADEGSKKILFHRSPFRGFLFFM